MAVYERNLDGCRLQEGELPADTALFFVYMLLPAGELWKWQTGTRDWDAGFNGFRGKIQLSSPSCSMLIGEVVPEFCGADPAIDLPASPNMPEAENRSGMAPAMKEMQENDPIARVAQKISTLFPQSHCKCP
ncbi:MAG: hypothetical protein QMD46_04725 [Methanomicrobiales archaeon]|nr:hypothetical protein [Methanomicrobiales archaeon]MDI6876392.1 hypothetical protein [Methanomicrobiales archaeon]